MSLTRNEIIETVVDLGSYFKIATRNAELPIRKTAGLIIRVGDEICYFLDLDDETIDMDVVLSRDGKKYAIAELYL